MDSSRARSRMQAAFESSNWVMAAHRARQILAEHPNEAEANFMLGVACLWSGHEDEAAAALEHAATLQPANASYLVHYATALGAARRPLEARAAADRATALHPDDATLCDMLGAVYLRLNAIKAAAAAHRRAVEIEPDNAPLRFRLGYVLIALGDAEGAERELEACIRLDPLHWPAYMALTGLRQQTPEHNHIERWRTLAARHAVDPVAQMFLNMAIAKENEDVGDYAAAFAHYTRGKAAARSLRAPSAERDHAMFEAIRHAFPTAEPTAATMGTDDAPIFIVGMPRTGTTLLDRMLSRHRDVAAAGETQNFATVLQRAAHMSTALLASPDIAAAVRNVDWPSVGAAYISSARPAARDRPRFTDDMPLNCLYAGFIARALPNARIVCLRRNPLDTCISNFRNLFQFESGFYEYTLDLLDIGRYFIEFDRLMAFWRKVLPGRILEIDYESLVASPEPVLRQVLSFCGLAWDAACVHPEGNPNPVHTPHAWQVRAPVYTSAIGRWRHYAPQLQPLRQLLLAGGIALPE